MKSDAAPGLVDVNGIGETYATELATVGVTDAAELAGEDADDLARRLADAGHPHGVRVVGNWIAEARRVTASLAATRSAAPSSSAEDIAVAESPAPDEPTFRPHDADEVGQLAGFYVWLDADPTGLRRRIRVYHDESGEERTIEGIDTSALLRFMLVDALSSATDPVPPAFREAARHAAFEPGEPAVARSKDGVEVSIVDVAVSAVSPPHARAEPWLKVDVRFEVDGLDAHDSSAEVAYLAEVLVIERETRTLWNMVNRHGYLDRGDGSYRAIRELPLPPVGAYDIETVVLLLPPVEAVACRRGRPLTITA